MRADLQSRVVSSNGHVATANTTPALKPKNACFEMLMSGLEPDKDPADSKRPSKDRVEPDKQTPAGPEMLAQESWLVQPQLPAPDPEKRGSNVASGPGFSSELPNASPASDLPDETAAQPISSSQAESAPGPGVREEANSAAEAAAMCSKEDQGAAAVGEHGLQKAAGDLESKTEECFSPGIEVEPDRSQPMFHPENTPGGTMGAQKLSPMMAAQDMPQSPPVQEQDLPGLSAGFDEHEQLLPETSGSFDLPAAQRHAMAFTQGVPERVEEQAAAVQTTSTLDIVQRTEELISNVAVRVQQADVSSVSVVIKPESGTELSLELRLRNGSVEAQAQLSAGNFVELRKEWPELQERLSRQGIHLGDLQLGGENFSNGGHTGRENHTAEFRGIPFRTEPLHCQAVNTTGRMVSVRQHPGWESWA